MTTAPPPTTANPIRALNAAWDGLADATARLLIHGRYIGGLELAAVEARRRGLTVEQFESAAWWAYQGAPPPEEEARHDV